MLTRPSPQTCVSVSLPGSQYLRTSLFVDGKLVNLAERISARGMRVHEANPADSMLRVPVEVRSIVACLLLASVSLTARARVQALGHLCQNAGNDGLGATVGYRVRTKRECANVSKDVNEVR